MYIRLNPIVLLSIAYVFATPSQPILNPRAKPAINEALGWKSAVKNSIIPFHKDLTVGGLAIPDASFV